MLHPSLKSLKLLTAFSITPILCLPHKAIYTIHSWVSTGIFCSSYSYSTPATLKALKSPAFLVYFCSLCSSLCLFSPCFAWLMPIYLFQVSTGSPETALKSGSLVLCCCSPRNMKNLPVTQPSGLQGAGH